jgi:hypothetical protein
MPTTATINGFRHPSPASQPSLWKRLRARLRACHLDQQLARGVDFHSDPALAPREQRLLQRDSRERIAAPLEEDLRDAGASVRLSSRVPLRGPGIAAARPELESLVVALRAADDCQVRAVALAHLLVINGASPLYGRGSEQELVAAAGEAYRALHARESV